MFGGRRERLTHPWQWKIRLHACTIASYHRDHKDSRQRTGGLIPHTLVADIPRHSPLCLVYNPKDLFSALNTHRVQKRRLREGSRRVNFVLIFILVEEGSILHTLGSSFDLLVEIEDVQPAWTQEIQSVGGSSQSVGGLARFPLVPFAQKLLWPALMSRMALNWKLTPICTLPSVFSRKLELLRPRIIVTFYKEPGSNGLLAHTGWKNDARTEREDLRPVRD